MAGCINCSKILEIKQWGDSFRFSNVGYQFRQCGNLKFTATDTVQVNYLTNMSNMFAGAVSMTTLNGMDSWNVSGVTNMLYMFQYARSFNQNLNRWCVSQFISQPTGFDELTTAWTLPNSRPRWGTCPP